MNTPGIATVPPEAVPLPRPTWTRMRLEHLELESLRAFQLPFEYNPSEPESVLIRVWVPENLQDSLWEHTKQLRSKRTESQRLINRELEPAIFVNLDDQFYPGPHVSFCVLAPVITVERRHDELWIAARFNIETSIMRYGETQRDGHELFFHDICLQYHHHSMKEVLVAMPQSDPSRAFTIVKNTKSELSPEAGLSFSQAPSGNVSVALTRSTELNVEYAISSWSVSSHRVFKGHQWYWAGTHGDTKLLTPDLTQTVKRHVVVKRIVSLEGFPFDGTKESYDKGHLREALKGQFGFRFNARVRVKQRHGRSYRLLVFSSNYVKAKFLKPIHEVEFSLQPDETWFDCLIGEGYHAGKGGGSNKGGDEKRSSIGDAAGEITEGGRDPALERESSSASKSTEDIIARDGEKGGTSFSTPENNTRVERWKDFVVEEEIAVGHGKTEKLYRERDGEDEKTSMPEKREPEAAGRGSPRTSAAKAEKETAGKEAKEKRFIFPLGNSVDIASMLDDAKEISHENFDKLQGKRLTDVLDCQGLWTLDSLRTSRREAEKAKQSERSVG